MNTQKLSPKTGACHCGKVQFCAQLPDEIDAKECNCSICEKIGFQHVIVPASKFEITSGKNDITTYTFNTSVAQHTFCKHCGVKPFYVPRSNPDGYSLNLRCMDREQFSSIAIRAFDGQNWELNACKLKHLSKDD